MGCGESKQSGVKAQLERKPASEASTYTPPQPPQRPVEAQPVVQAPPQPLLSTPVATSVPTGSLSKKAATGGNAAIYAASIDRRNREVEFFKNIVRQTEEYVDKTRPNLDLDIAQRVVVACWVVFRSRRDFLDVSQSAVDYEAGDNEGDDALGAKLRGLTVQPERMEFSGLPRPSAKNQDNVIAILSWNGLSQERLEALEVQSNAIAAGYDSIAIQPGAIAMVLPLH
jgi:hypothetical protein